MTEFTFFEIHFEDGSIPAVDRIETADDDVSDDQDDGACGLGPGAIVLGFVLVVVAVALTRKLLAEGGLDEE